MVKIGKLPRPSENQPPVNPYGLVRVSVGGQETVARPFEWDSEPVGHDGFNAAGQPLKPTKAMTSCPSCGAGIEIMLTVGTSVACVACGLGVELMPLPLPDPFRNPLLEGLLKQQDLDPELVPPPPPDMAGW